MTPGVVPMIAPDGSTGDIPTARAQEAMAAGFKPAVVMTSPDGRMGYIPRERANDALKAGFKVGQPTTEAQAPERAGFTVGNIAKNVGQGLVELGRGGVQMLDDVGGAILPQFMGGDPLTKTKLAEHIIDPMQAEAEKSRQGGPGSVGHAIASGIPVIGPYAAQLGEQAGSGDIGGALTKGVTQALAPEALAKIPAKIPALSRNAAQAGLLGKTPAEAYESALKPPTAIKGAARDRLIQSGLENEIPISKGGLEKINDSIAALDTQREAVIAKDPNRPVNPQFDNWIKGRAKAATQVNPGADVAAYDSAMQEFLDTHGASIPAERAQQLKSGTYQALGDKAYKRDGLGAAAENAQKDLARDLKDEIAVQFPELKNLNATESRLLDLKPVMEKAVARIGNHQFMGISTPMITGVVKAVTGRTDIGIAAGVMKAILDDPMVKSRLAIAVSKGAKVPLAVARSRVQAYAARIGQTAAAQGSASSADNPANPASTETSEQQQ